MVIEREATIQTIQNYTNASKHTMGYPNGRREGGVDTTHGGMHVKSERPAQYVQIVQYALV